jgi:hypothetical protein
MTSVINFLFLILINLSIISITHFINLLLYIEIYLNLYLIPILIHGLDLNLILTFPHIIRHQKFKISNSYFSVIKFYFYKSKVHLFSINPIPAVFLLEHFMLHLSFLKVKPTIFQDHLSIIQSISNPHLALTIDPLIH